MMDDSDEEYQEMEEMAAALVGLYYMSRVKTNPCRDSALSGSAYVKEILNGNKVRCREVCRMDLPVFHKLCDIVRKQGILHDTSRVAIEEQLAMFLFTVGHSAGNRLVQERFQHSGETVSRYFNQVLHALTELSTDFIRPSSNNTPIEILTDSRFYPYFQDCLGAIDGTHVAVIVGADEQALFRDRKGNISQNVMAACSFDLKFTHVLSGWEGSAADGRVLLAAREKDFKVPEGKFYLVDAGYPNLPNFIAPYRGVRYHLKEFGNGRQAPQNAKELFNHRHSSLRNAVERIFGILKARFAILKMPHPFSFPTQAKLVVALCVLHNHIRVECGGDDWVYEEYDSQVQNTDCGIQSEGQSHETVQRSSIKRQLQEAKALRDSIAISMWNDYLK
ncbi:hypothetical protein LguiA_027260 [Lonicera macranthoides]